MAWLKREGGVAHVFASALVRGRPRQPPTRVDAGQLGEASELGFGAGADYGAMAAWIDAGKVYAARRPPGLRSAWGPPQLVYGDPLPARELSFDVTLFGTGYAVFTVGTDLRAARLPWHQANWTVIPRPLDIDPAAVARDADVAASADGSAVVAWTESTVGGPTRVWTRRIRENGELSGAPREASVRNFRGRPGGNADSPSLDVTDESSYAFLAFRQDFTDAGVTVSRALGRRLVASQFEAPRPIDGLGFPTTDGAAAPHIAATGRARGIAAAPLRSGGAVGTAIFRREPLDARWFRPVRLDLPSPNAAAVPPPITATMAEGERGVAVWQHTPAGGLPTLQGRYWDADEFDRAVTISNPAFGPVEPLGLFSGSDDRTDSVVGFVQGGDANRRVLVAAWDGPIRPAAIPNRPYWTRNRRPTLRWRAVSNVLWGPVRYSVEIDGVRHALTRRTRWRPRRNLPDGAHAARINQIDGRGYESPGLDRPLWIDTTPPRVQLRGGRLYANDGTAIRGSGIASLRVVLRRGSYAVRVPSIGVVRGARVRGRPVRFLVADKAGNRASINARAARR
jgi:hypothetical protein